MYTETTAASVEDLLNQIAVAAFAEGWTVHRNVLDGDLRTVTLQKSGDYIHLWNTSTSNFYVRASADYDSLEAPDDQPDVSVSRALCNCGTGPFGEVFFFAEDSPAEHFYTVINMDGTHYRHMAFGELVKYGTFTGGTFFDALNYDSGDVTSNGSPLDSDHHQMFSCSSNTNTNAGGVRCDVDGNTNYFAPFTNPNDAAGPAATGGMGQESNSNTANWGDGFRTQSGFFNRSINSWTGRTPMQHIQIRVERPDNFYSPLGEVPNMRYINMTRFVAGQEFSLGSDTWKVFPWVKQGAPVPHSGQHAFAYKKVA